MRANCATATPAFPSFGIATICDSVNRDYFIGLPSAVKSCQKSPVRAVYRSGKLSARLRRPRQPDAFFAWYFEAQPT